MELLPGERLGKYEVVRRLAAGGMAEIYLAKSLGHGGFAKPVALKRILPDLSIELGFREMFMQEAAVASRLNNPHIVQIFDFAEERGQLYLAMEFVHGVNLRTLLLNSLACASEKQDPSLRVPAFLAASICANVARALHHAWNVPDEEGKPSHLIHRDVSPHNILLSYEGDTKLADFGIAKPADLHTIVGVLKGKLRYMAPEQIAGKPLDARTDIYALGIVLYEAALGLRTPLFDGESDASIRTALQQRIVVPPIRMEPSFPPELSAIIMKSLERDVSMRFQSAAEFAKALGECIHREAQGPQEYDLALFMKHLYGDPPLLGLANLSGLTPPKSSSAAATNYPPDFSKRTTKRAPDSSSLPRSNRKTTVERVSRKAGIPARPESLVRWYLALASLAAAALAIFFVWQPTERDPQSNNQPRFTDSPPPSRPNSNPSPKPPPPLSQPEAPIPSHPTPEPLTKPANSENSSSPLAPKTHKTAAWGTLVVDFKPNGWGTFWIGKETERQEAVPRADRKLPVGKHVVHLLDDQGIERKIVIQIYPNRVTTLRPTKVTPR